MVNPERKTAGEGNQESEEKRNSSGPSFRLRLVLQRANNGMETVQVEPDKDVNGGIDEEYDGAVKEVADGVGVDGDHLPEGAQRKEEANSKVRYGQADDVQVESLTEKKSFLIKGKVFWGKRTCLRSSRVQKMTEMS